MRSLYIGAVMFCIFVCPPAQATNGMGFRGSESLQLAPFEGRFSTRMNFGRIIHPNALNVEISIFDVESQTIGNKVRISWKVSGDEENGVYTVERSGNGVGFTAIGTFEDNDPLNGNNFYRIVFSGRINQKIYSKTVISAFISQESFRAYYAFDGRIRLNLDLKTSGIYQIAIVNYMGQAIYKNELKYDGGKNTFEISPTGNLNQGIYAVMLSGNGIKLSCQILIK